MRSFLGQAEAFLIAAQDRLARNRKGKDTPLRDDQAAPFRLRYAVDSRHGERKAPTDRLAAGRRHIDDSHDLTGRDRRITVQMEIHGFLSSDTWRRGFQ